MFLNFPATLKVKVIETGELVSGGGIQVPKHLDLVYMQLILYAQGTMAGTEALRVRLFADQAMATAPVATSAYSALSRISGLTAHWIGRLRFDFNGEQLNKNSKYWVGVDASGYTRSGDTRYLSLALDYAFAQVGQPGALCMALYGNRWLG